MSRTLTRSPGSTTHVGLNYPAARAIHHRRARRGQALGGVRPARVRARTHRWSSLRCITVRRWI